MPNFRMFLLSIAFAIGLISAHCLAATPDKADSRLAKIEQQQQAYEAKVDVQIEKIHNEMQSAKDALETARKNLEWWISFIGIFLTAVGVVGAAVPYFFTKQERQRLREELESARRAVEVMDRDKRDIQDKLAEAQRLAEEAKTLVENIRDHEREAEQHLRNIARADAPQADIDKSLRTLRKGTSAAAKLAERALGAGEDKNWSKAAALWEALTELQPDNAQAWFNLAYARNELAVASNQATEQQRRAVCDAWEKVIRLEPENSAAWSNWGNALASWARTLQGEAATEKFALASEKYAEATKHKPDDHEAWNNWGTAQIHWAHTLQGGARRAKLLEARTYCETAEKLQPGLGAYNLACIAALLGEPDTARQWLLKSQEFKKLPDLKHLSTDHDLDSLRELDWFKELAGQS